MLTSDPIHLFGYFVIQPLAASEEIYDPRCYYYYYYYHYSELYHAVGETTSISSGCL